MKRYNWKKIDWELHDAEIARRVGCTRAGVGKARKRLGKPPSKMQTKPKKSSQKQIALEVCRRFEKLYAMGINDVLPAWMHPTMGDIYALAEEALKGNSQEHPPL